MHCQIEIWRQIKNEGGGGYVVVLGIPGVSISLSLLANQKTLVEKSQNENHFGLWPFVIPVYDNQRLNT